MPRVNLGKKEPNRIKGLIGMYADTNGKSRPQLAKMAGVSDSTIYARLRCPEDFTLGELAGLGRGLGIPIEELRACIKY